jgi:predicted amidohydrolase YtcJ
MSTSSLWLLAALFAVPQDLHLEGLRVFTGTGADWPAAVVVREGRIAAPGSGPPAGAVSVRLDGFLYPGLADAHAHLVGLGAALEDVDLVGTASFEQVVARVRERASKTPKGEWIVGRGWDQNDWPTKTFPAHDALSAATPDHPVWLTRIDGHAALANRRAMELTGLKPGTEAPAGGEIVRDADGAPTGVLVDRAMALVGGGIPEATAAQIERRLLAAQQACLAAGLTSVHDAGMPPATIAILRRLHAARQWKLRVYAMLPASATEAIEQGPYQTPDGVITVRAVKGYADGALGSYGAALLEPYADRPGHRGLLITPQAQLARLAQLCADHGFQLCVHAIGDAANRAVLEAFAAAKHPHGARAARFRIEHAQVVDLADFGRFHALGIVPSMQPTHLTSDMPWAPARLGADRVRGAYAWRRFHELGLPVAFGSDFPVEGHDPRLGLYAAVTTRPAAGGDELRPDQKLSRERAIAGFTADAAFAAFAERDLGTVEPGKRADFTVVDRDLLACPERDLLAARVLLTVIGGEVVYRSER